MNGKGIANAMVTFRKSVDWTYFDQSAKTVIHGRQERTFRFHLVRNQDLCGWKRLPGGVSSRVVSAIAGLSSVIGDVGDDIQSELHRGAEDDLKSIQRQGCSVFGYAPFCNFNHQESCLTRSLSRVTLFPCSNHNNLSNLESSVGVSIRELHRDRLKTLNRIA